MVSPAPPPFDQVYVRDLQAKTTVLASLTSTGGFIAQSTGEAGMSNAGVAFVSGAAGVVPDADGAKQQVYFRLL